MLKILSALLPLLPLRLCINCNVLMTNTTNSPLPKPYEQGTYVETKFGHIYYEVDGEGIPVVMINGGPGASRTVFWGALDFLK